jgi:hypothetical protein
VRRVAGGAGWGGARGRAGAWWELGGWMDKETKEWTGEREQKKKRKKEKEENEK